MWLESVGFGRNTKYWKQEATILRHPKLSREDFIKLKMKYDRGVRQKRIGER